MLSNNSISAATELSNALTSAGIEVAVANGRPLSAISSALQPISTNGENIPLAVQQAARPISSEYDPHSGETQVVAKVLAARVSANINLARNTVNPLIREIVTKCESRKREIETKSPLNVNVRHVYVSPLFTNEGLATKYSRFNTGVFKEVTLPQELRKLILEGMSDEAFKTAIGGLGEEWDKGVDIAIDAFKATGWTEARDVLFRTTEALPLGSASLLTDSTNLLNFLLLDAILGGKVSSFPLGEVSVGERAEISKAHAYYGSRVSRQVKTIVDWAKTGRFILPSGSSNKEVFIYDRNYRKWLDKGGTSEALIAAVADANDLFSIAGSIVNDFERYEKRYDSIERLHRNKQRAATANEIRDVVQMALFSHIHSEMEAGSREAAIGAAREFFATNQLQTNGDVLDYVRRGVCETIAAGTNVLQILCDIDSYLQDNPNDTIQRAAVWAGARILGQWCANQLVITKTSQQSLAVTEL